MKHWLITIGILGVMPHWILGYASESSNHDTEWVAPEYSVNGKNQLIDFYALRVFESFLLSGLDEDGKEIANKKGFQEDSPIHFPACMRAGGRFSIDASALSPNVKKWRANVYHTFWLYYYAPLVTIGNNHRHESEMDGNDNGYESSMDDAKRILIQKWQKEKKNVCARIVSLPFISWPTQFQIGIASFNGERKPFVFGNVLARVARTPDGRISAVRFEENPETIVTVSNSLQGGVFGEEENIILALPRIKNETRLNILESEKYQWLLDAKFNFASDMDDTRLGKFTIVSRFYIDERGITGEKPTQYDQELYFTPRVETVPYEAIVFDGPFTVDVRVVTERYSGADSCLHPDYAKSIQAMKITIVDIQ